MSIYLIVMLSIQTALVIYALQMDKEGWRLAVLVVLENIWYSHLINAITVIAGLDYITKKQSGWNKVARLGKNIATPVRTV